MKIPVTFALILSAVAGVLGQVDKVVEAPEIGVEVDRTTDVRAQLANDANGRFDLVGEFKGAVHAAPGVEVTKVNAWDDLKPHAVYFRGTGDLEIEPVIEPSKLNDETVVRGPVLFVQFRIKPALDKAGRAPAVVDVAGVQVSFRTLPSTDRTGELLIRPLQEQKTSGRVLEESQDDWVRTGVYFALTENGIPAISQDLTVRLDLFDQEFDLWHFNRLVVADFAYEPRAHHLWLRSVSSESSQITDLRATVDNPLFDDADVDGIPDAFEESVGSSALFDDRDWIVPGLGRNLTELYLMQSRLTSAAPRP